MQTELFEAQMLLPNPLRGSKVFRNKWMFKYEMLLHLIFKWWSGVASMIELISLTVLMFNASDLAILIPFF